MIAQDARRIDCEIGKQLFMALHLLQQRRLGRGSPDAKGGDPVGRLCGIATPRDAPTDMPSQ